MAPWRRSTGWEFLRLDKTVIVWDVCRAEWHRPGSRDKMRGTPVRDHRHRQNSPTKLHQGQPGGPGRDELPGVGGSDGGGIVPVTEYSWPAVYISSCIFFRWMVTCDLFCIAFGFLRFNYIKELTINMYMLLPILFDLVKCQGYM